MKIKTSELIGPALDWAVAKCEGVLFPRSVPKYTTDWAQGGPIIEREEIGIRKRAPCFPQEEWEASGSITARGAGYRFAVGPAPLSAAMRCYVASKLGNEIEIPEELK